MTDILKEKIIIRAIKVYKNREEWEDQYVKDNYSDAIQYMKEYFDKLFPTAVGSDCVEYSERWLSWKNDWYFFNLDCYMETSKWVYWKDKWYYLGSYGAMLTNCVTPDGYRVDKDGAWIK